MIVYDFNPFWSLFIPEETNAVTVVNPDGMLPSTVTAQDLQVVTRRHPWENPENRDVLK